MLEAIQATLTKMDIITNNVPRDLVTYNALPENVKPNFDYLSEDDVWSARFFCYKKTWYDALEIVASNVPGWDGIIVTSFSSGILVKFVEGGERVVVGLCLS